MLPLPPLLTESGSASKQPSVKAPPPPASGGHPGGTCTHGCIFYLTLNFVFLSLLIMLGYFLGFRTADLKHLKSSAGVRGGGGYGLPGRRGVLGMELTHRRTCSNTVPRICESLRVSPQFLSQGKNLFLFFKFIRNGGY